MMAGPSHLHTHSCAQQPQRPMIRSPLLCYSVAKPPHCEKAPGGSVGRICI